VEAPSLIKNEGTYYLTFSSNMYNTNLYDTSFATASSVTGPYTKAQAPDAPILTSDMMGLYGPGGADMFIVPGQNAVMLFHGWDSDQMNARYLYATSFNAEDGKIEIYWG
jgi:beta-xylosidase